jgi:hypothetical protein
VNAGTFTRPHTGPVASPSSVMITCAKPPFVIGLACAGMFTKAVQVIA